MKKPVDALSQGVGGYGKRPEGDDQRYQHQLPEIETITGAPPSLPAICLTVRDTGGGIAATVGGAGFGLR